MEVRPAARCLVLLAVTSRMRDCTVQVDWSMGTTAHRARFTMDHHSSVALEALTMPLDVQLGFSLLAGIFVWLCGFYAGYKKGRSDNGSDKHP